MIDFICQATQAVPVIPVEPTTWGAEVAKVIGALFGAVGGTAGVIAIIMAWKYGGRAQAQGQALNQQHAKINELAEKNPAEVAPLPPMPPDCTDNSKTP